jgi:hypothetical protein
VPFVPGIKEKSDVSNVDPEFLNETPEETPVVDSILAAVAGEDGDFDNFTYKNPNYIDSELDQVPFGGDRNTVKRPMTEILDLKQSFAGLEEMDDP